MTTTYDQIGGTYSHQRTTDPRIASVIHAALGASKSVLNVGAGTGSYEPTDREVVAVEPSRVMITQRSADRAPAVQAVAEWLPFADNSFDALLGVLTLHHWNDQQRGLSECARIARNVVVFLTWDPTSEDFWLVRDYFPSLIAQDRTRFPTPATIGSMLGAIEVQPVLIPADCIDGFLGAYWRRPEAYLSESVRSGISSFASCANLDSGLQKLQADLESGAWHRKQEDLLHRDSLDLGYRLVTVRVK
ncbi:MAG: class I SAM-dependent methyltransferase [Gemmatimonadaceae bacterium]